ncbi:hypothetical protein Curi_c21220 [Gottschalkia acidurici 9a]|uniref:DUF4179 domain-containing protein n=1 Tax=Gottschalkia acidurici (strain ATCC 7906 / DSM 604 / BCRC 14475 / CIP 104303 / KCTC 5404 / NCIMB 10678 / 9a) TaxID=1128398 RepID=K0B3B4_GOTA9|nr:DUF4179 domain-containing protein [Gottschalkia acidurici]AFS79126.1 hypothetical protein Curi_c21220 [Gottschalkia acidurici 9a]
MNKKGFNLEEKDIYKLFNGIKIDESEFEDMNEKVNCIQKERIKKNLNKKMKEKKGSKSFKYGVTAAAIGVVCVIGVGVTNPSLAKNVPVLNSIIQTLNDKYGTNGEYDKYSHILGESVTDKGVTITINEVLSDESKLLISYTIKSDKKIKDKENMGMFIHNDIKINGKRMDATIGSSIGKYIDEYTYVCSDEIDIEKLNLPEEFNVDFKITDIIGTDIEIQGKWNFAFNVSKEEISKNTNIFKPKKTIDFPNSIVNIDKVTLSPIGTYISLSGNYKEGKRIEDISGIFEYDNWIAFDDRGVELVPNGIGGGEANKSKFNSKMNYGKLDYIPEYLTIIPCKVTPSGGGGVSIDKDGKETPVAIKTKKPKEVSKVIDGTYPIELSQGKMGKLIIKDIKTENGTTIVKYTAEGKAPYTQGSSLYIKDQKGNHVNVKNYDIRKDKANPNEFTMEFEALDPNNKYTIYTTDFNNFELGEEFKFNIELK